MASLALSLTCATRVGSSKALAMTCCTLFMLVVSAVGHDSLELVQSRLDYNRATWVDTNIPVGSSGKKWCFDAYNNGTFMNTFGNSFATKEEAQTRCDEIGRDSCKYIWQWNGDSSNKEKYGHWWTCYSEMVYELLTTNMKSKSQRKEGGVWKDKIVLGSSGKKWCFGGQNSFGDKNRAFESVADAQAACETGRYSDGCEYIWQWNNDDTHDRYGWWWLCYQDPWFFENDGTGRTRKRSR